MFNTLSNEKCDKFPIKKQALLCHEYHGHFQDKIISWNCPILPSIKVTLSLCPIKIINIPTSIMKQISDTGNCLQKYMRLEVS